ncbi:hypothetical protein ABZ678_33645, partial [Streptomyces hirsutus]
MLLVGRGEQFFRAGLDGVEPRGGGVGMGGLRELAAPFVVPGPSGVAIRTRLKQLTAADEEV